MGSSSHKIANRKSRACFSQNLNSTSYLVNPFLQNNVYRSSITTQDKAMLNCTYFELSFCLSLRISCSVVRIIIGAKGPTEKMIWFKLYFLMLSFFFFCKCHNGKHRDTAFHTYVPHLLTNYVKNKNSKSLAMLLLFAASSQFL